MKQDKSDQLVIPISLQEGMALRATAAAFDISLASLVRRLIRLGLGCCDDWRPTYEQELRKITSLTPLQLLQAKSGPLIDNHIKL